MKTRILILDDDKLILEVIGEFLEQKGFEVIAHTLPKQALQILQKEPVDLIISDVVMPQMDGFEFYNQVNLFNPDIPFIFMTGYEHDVKIVEKLKKLKTTWMPKPIELIELLDIVNQKLNSRS